MLALDITANEVTTGQMTPDHIAAAVHAVHTDGFVVLNNVVDPKHLAILREKMLADTQAILARDDTPFNFNSGNLQQDPPPFPPYLFRDVLVNDMVIAVTKGVLGPGVKSAFYSGNTALQSTQRQPVHADLGQLWKGLEVATPAYGLVVNVGVVPMSPENGSTELWPGTHLDTTVDMHRDIKIPEDVLERRRQVAPPFQPTIPLGSVLIRDLRLWHAGMPNRTEHPRSMIAMIHYCGWYGWAGSLKFPKGTEDFFQHPDLHTVAEFVDTPVDHIHAPQAYDYDREKEPAASS
jgi:hypothetical protein